MSAPQSEDMNAGWAPPPPAQDEEVPPVPNPQMDPEKEYVVLTESGKVVSIGLMKPVPGTLFAEVPHGVVIPEADSSSLELFYEGGVFVWKDSRTLEQAKDQKKAQINVWRASANTSFIYSGKTFQADDLSWKEISGTHGWVTATQSLPPGFPGQWKATDNTYVPIPDVPTWMLFYGAALSRGVHNFQKSELLKAQVAAATTVAEVDAIVW